MIETKRLILRPFIEKDAEDVFEYLFSQKDPRRIYTYTKDYNLSCQLSKIKKNYVFESGILRIIF